MTWRQGEHVAIIGQTGSGKSYLETKLLPYRKHVIILRTKPDPKIRFEGFKKIRSIDGMTSNRTRFLLEPKYERQPYECARALDLAWREGGWCVAIDEAFYIDRLRLRPWVERLLTQGRSLGITVVSGMQRPVQITRFTISEATHVFAFHCEGREVLTVAEATTPRMRDAIPQLHRYEFAYYNRKTKAIIIGRAQDLPEVLAA